MLRSMAPAKRASAAAAAANAAEPSSDSPKKSGTSSNSLGEYTVNERVLCTYGDQYYEAKVLDETESEGVEGILVHYLGWNKRHDEFIPKAELQKRLKKFDAAEAANAKSALKQAQKQAVTPKNVKGKPATKGASTAKSASKAKVKKEEADTTPPAKTPTRGAGLTAKAAKGTKKRARSTASRSEETVTPPMKKVATTRSRRTEEVKEEPKVEVKSQAASEKTRVKPSKRQQDAIKQLEALINTDLAHALTEDRERVQRRNKLPKTPAKFTIETIMQEFARSKDKTLEPLDDKISDQFENELVPKDDTIENVLACLLNLFDCTVQRFLLYGNEKEFFQTLGNEDGKAENENGEPIVRYSKRVGITYLIRFISRLEKFLNDEVWGATTVDQYVKVVTDLMPFLTSNLTRFYDADEYYELPSRTETAVSK